MIGASQYITTYPSGAGQFQPQAFSSSVNQPYILTRGPLTVTTCPANSVRFTGLPIKTTHIFALDPEELVIAMCPAAALRQTKPGYATASLLLE